MEMIKVVITDDHNLICEGMEKIINSQTDMKMLYSAGSGKELLQKLRDNSDNLPDIILLDIEMPELSGFDALTKVLRAFPEIKVVMLTFHNEPHYIMHLIEKGASGYINKNCASEELLKTIRMVKSHGKYFDQETVVLMTQRFSREYRKSNKLHFQDKNLTNTEIKIIELICQELTSQQIADFCKISMRTVESHRYSIFRKVGVENSLGLMKYAISAGIFNPDANKKSDSK